jgi:hypothetical protein
MRLEIFESQAGKIFHPADNRPVIGLNLKSRGHHLLLEKGLWIIFCAKTPFFHDNHSFRLEVLLPEDKVLHPI